MLSKGLTVSKSLLIYGLREALFIYGKVTIIKSILVSKFVYVCSILPTPKQVESELNRLLFKFLWNGVHEVTRVSAINDYEKGGIKMIDVDCMIRSSKLV